MKRATLILAALAMLLGGVGQTQADVVLYTSESAFDAATTGLTTVDFNGIASSDSFVSYGTGPLSLSGVSFTGNGSMFVIDPGFYGYSYSNGGFLTSDYSSPDIITATLPGGGFTAVGTDFGSLFSGGATFTITLSTGDTFTVSTSGSIEFGTLGFVGFTSSTPITSITFSMPDTPNYNALDNFQFGTAVAVPEPTSVVVFGMATLAGAVYCGWRRRKQPAQA